MVHSMTIGGLVLAGGAARRFGGGKLLARLDGRPLLEHAVGIMDRSAAERTVVVLGADAQDILRESERGALDLASVRPVVCASWEEGQAASLRCGIEALGDVECAVVLLGDEPRIAPSAVDRVLGARRAGAAAVRATWEGRPGHPVVLERELLDDAHRLRGDVGARALFAGHEVVEVACDGLGEAGDIDTRDQLEEMQR